MSNSVIPDDITIFSFRVEIEPLNGDGSIMELIVYPDKGNCWPAHPDKTILDLEAGDVFVHRDWKKRETRYRFKRACAYGSTLCRESHPWCDSIREATEAISNR